SAIMHWMAFTQHGRNALRQITKESSDRVLHHPLLFSCQGVRYRRLEVILTTVAPGYFRNHLMPKLLALPNIEKFAHLIREQRRICQPEEEEEVKVIRKSEDNTSREFEKAARRLENARLGGLGGAQAFAKSEKLVHMLKKQKESNRPYGAICASPALVLEPNGLLKGKKATAFPAMCNKLSDQSEIENRVVVDGNLITSRGPGTSMEFALATVEKFFGCNKALELAKIMLFTRA
ncbi:hypothetical protein CUMW_232120, partial [Citrus unshiu]